MKVYLDKDKREGEDSLSIAFEEDNIKNIVKIYFNEEKLLATSTTKINKEKLNLILSNFYEQILSPFYISNFKDLDFFHLELFKEESPNDDKVICTNLEGLEGVKRSLVNISLID